MRRCAAILLVLLAPLARARGAEDPHAAHEHGAEMGAGWTTHLHAYAFLVTNYQDGPSGDRDFESENHLMVAAGHPLLGGRLSLLGTFTLEPVTIPPEGSPLLFQRGETYHGVLLIDRQHPHDLFVELAAAWERRLSPASAFRIYLAPVGEPPVGPTSYTHRLSSSALPAAPLTHHNLDSTHLSADVVSAGVGLGRVTIEAGVFHGREPGENRFDIDGGPLDSYAGRLSVRPVEGLTLQASAARRTHPEAIEDGNQTRQTLSAEYERELPGGFVAATLAFGRNLLPGGEVERGDLLEGVWKLESRHTLTARVESVDRDVYELTHKAQRPDAVAPETVRVGALTLGYLHDLPEAGAIDLAAGIAATTYTFAAVLNDAYGRRPFSAQLFLRATLGHHGGAAMHHHAP